MGRLDGRGSLVDGREMNTVSVNVTFGVVGLLRSFDSWIVRVSCFFVGLSACLMWLFCWV